MGWRAGLPGRLAKVDELLAAQYPPGGPGACAQVAVDGEPLLRKGYGLADVGAGVPVTLATVFDLASVSKQFTGLAVLLLARRGLLAPGDDVRRYLPELSGLPLAGRPLVLGDLLHHTSGLPDYVAYVPPEEYPPFTNARLLGWVAGQEFVFAPGSRGVFLDDREAYSNTNYALLATVVERVSGRAFPDFLRAEVFGPLGMADSVCDPWGVGRARRYGPAGEPVGRPRDIPTYGDGNVYGSAEDFLRWDAGLACPTLVERDWLERAFTPGALDDGTETDYAWGWFVGWYGGRRAVWHGGGWDGTSTYYARWPEEGLGVAVLSNTRQVEASAVGARVERVLLGL
jgi:CubicO group peptidase (beta-lactamase class C family)